MNDNCRIGFGFNVKEIWEIKLTERYYDNTGNETSDIKQASIPCIARKKLISTWPISGDSQPISGDSQPISVDSQNEAINCYCEKS